jgi:polar amino acid transport system permease protein
MRTFGYPEFLFILEAARWTIALSLIAFVGGAVGGLAVALARTSESGAARAVATAFVQVFQGTPLLLQLFLIFFGAPVLGLDINPWVAAGVALVLNTSAFLGEIWRGSIQAIPRGQWEAAQALGLHYVARMRDVILPQAFKIALPPTVGYMVQVIKGTSLAAIIGFTEVTRAGQIINNATFQPLVVFSLVAAIYFALCWPLSLLASYMERRQARALAR